MIHPDEARRAQAVPEPKGQENLLRSELEYFRERCPRLLAHLDRLSEVEQNVIRPPLEMARQAGRRDVFLFLRGRQKVEGEG